MQCIYVRVRIRVHGFEEKTRGALIITGYIRCVFVRMQARILLCVHYVGR